MRDPDAVAPARSARDSIAAASGRLTFESVMVIVYLCGIVAVVAAVIWAAWQRGAVGSLGRAVLALLTAAVTLVVVVAGAYLAALALGLARAYDFGGVVLVTGATMGLLVFGPIAFAAWIVTLFGFRHARGRAKADVQGFPGRAARGWVGVWPVVGVVSVAVLVAIAVSYHAERNKPADDHDIVALRFVDGSRTIYALNDANVLKIWRLAQPLPLEARKPDGPSPYALQASIPLPLTYVPNDMRVSRDGRHVALRDNTGIIVYGIDAAGRQAASSRSFPAPLPQRSTKAAS
jgi:hypothetical protein